MKAVGIKVLKNKLSEYVRLASRGETVLVTDRDTVVAEIVPPQQGRASSLDDAILAEAIRKGWMHAPARPLKRPPPRKPVAKWKVIARELDNDRQDR
jgi:antitoxin (DNA-binding transcriptional repressor) of toxin-antitoxin stability system